MAVHSCERWKSLGFMVCPTRLMAGVPSHVHSETDDQAERRTAGGTSGRASTADRVWEAFKQTGKANADRVVQAMRGGGPAPPRTQEALSPEGLRTAESLARERGQSFRTLQSSDPRAQALLALLLALLVTEGSRQLFTQGSMTISRALMTSEALVLEGLSGRPTRPGFQQTQALRGRGGFLSQSGLDVRSLFGGRRTARSVKKREEGFDNFTQSDGPGAADFYWFWI